MRVGRSTSDGTAASFGASSMTERLLIHPRRTPDEGPCGYAMRLADLNLVSAVDVYNLLGSEALGFVSGTDPAPRTQALALLGGRARCCPGCLEGRKRWMVAWEIAHADACPLCGRWLVDQCSQCGKALTWTRPRLFECLCGHSLTDESQGEAPDAVVQMATALQSMSMDEPLGRPPLNGMSLGAAVDAIRFLGSLAAGVPKSRIQSEYRLQPLEVSWTVTTAAAEVLREWPHSLWGVLDRIRENHPEEQRGQLLRLFSPVYPVLYKGTGAQKFTAIREAFEAYLVQRWPGQLVSRHRRMAGHDLPEPSWLRVSQASKLTGLSRRTLRKLAESGELISQKWKTVGGRNYMLLRRDEIDALLSEHGRAVDLCEAARRLGLAESRASQILSCMKGVVPPLWLGGRWSIPEHIITRWELYLQGLPISYQGLTKLITLSDVIKYLLPDGQALTHLLNDVEQGKLQVLGKMSGVHGLPALRFERSTVDFWLKKQRPTYQTIAVRNCAKLLLIKEEVVYAITRKGLLQTKQIRVGRRSERHTTNDWLAEFKSKYVFGSHIARSLGTSARHLRECLIDQGVVAVAGPGVDNCRQLVYDRAVVEKALKKMGLSLPYISDSKKSEEGYGDDSK